jgi:hypothetical protein
MLAAGVGLVEVVRSALGAVESADHQRSWRAACALRRGREPCCWVAPPAVLLRRLVDEGCSLRRIGREAGVSHHTASRAADGERIY